MNRLDGCETVFYSDGSVRIEVIQKDYLCFDLFEIAALFQKARGLTDSEQSKCRDKLIRCNDMPLISSC